MPASFRIFAAVEGRSDARRLRVLVRAALARAISEEEWHWLSADDADPDAQLALVGLDQADYFDFHGVKAFQTRVLGRRVLYGGAIGSRECQLLRALMMSLRVLQQRGKLQIDGVIWLRDTDGDARRGPALRDARDADAEPSLPLVIGTPNQTSEAWVLAGFRAMDADEDRTLRTLRADLSFDPVAEPHRLLHQAHAERGAKEALSRLIDDDVDREAEALQEAVRHADSPVVELRANSPVELRALLDELRARIFRPLFAP